MRLILLLAMEELWDSAVQVDVNMKKRAPRVCCKLYPAGRPVYWELLLRIVLPTLVALFLLAFATLLTLGISSLANSASLGATTDVNNTIARASTIAENVGAYLGNVQADVLLLSRYASEVLNGAIQPSSTPFVNYFGITSNDPNEAHAIIRHLPSAPRGPIVCGIIQTTRNLPIGPGWCLLLSLQMCFA